MSCVCMYVSCMYLWMDGHGCMYVWMDDHGRMTWAYASWDDWEVKATVGLDLMDT